MKGCVWMDINAVLPPLVCAKVEELKDKHFLLGASASASDI